ncbi:hydroxylamine reductase, partial [Paraclostridium sp. AKS46]|nr:hydroxylamine reductase [Paraclostridium sp. AKS46]
MENKMFCFQCQETAGCTGCTKFGVCGKSPDLARMQDLLIYTTKGLSEVTTRLRKEGKKVSSNVNHLITINLFTTITNANFDDEVFYARVKETLKTKEDLLSQLSNKSNLSEAALWNASSNAEMDVKVSILSKIKDAILGSGKELTNDDINKLLDEKSTKVGVLATKDEDIRSLRELIIYGLKGLAAYMKHANALGYDDEKINAFMQATLAKTLDDSLSIDELIGLTLETGKVGVDGMALLDSANTGTYGHPEITKVDIGVRNNPGILISGHDLKDLELLLKQTEGTGVDVYTHSEMLPAHYYPAFKKYSHFAGN